IAEHHREMALLGTGVFAGPGNSGGRHGGLGVTWPTAGDGPQKLLAVAEGNAELDQVRLGQLGQHVDVDVLGGEGFGIALESDALQPTMDRSHATNVFPAAGMPSRCLSRYRLPGTGSVAKRISTLTDILLW